MRNQGGLDQSWAYAPNLALEAAEVSILLMALSLPKWKPAVDRWVPGRRTGRFPASIKDT
jgi:hypothetical protein